MIRRVVLVVSAVAILGDPSAPWAAPIRVRYPEGPSHGFVALTAEDGRTLAHGELEQWLRRDTVVSRLSFHFDDGSVYDETVRFSQRQVFRIESYRLVQRGPSFTESVDLEFDRSGRYRVRRRASPDDDEETEAGRADLPDDLMNGIISVVCKNVMPDGAATAHLVAFRPKPLVMEVHVHAEGTDRYRVGALARVATRFRVQPEVGGVMGALATLTGKQPAPLRMWMARGRAPVLVRFEGQFYTDGPTWRVQPTGPRWPP